MSSISDIYVRFKPEITLAAIILVFSGMISLSYHLSAATLDAIETPLELSSTVDESGAPAEETSPLAEQETVEAPEAPPAEEEEEPASEPMIRREVASETPAATPSPDLDMEVDDADVLVTEEAYGTIADGEVELTKAGGSVVIRNSGNRDRIWDVNLYLEDFENTSFEEDVVHISELKPGDVEELAYEVAFTEAPIIVKEVIDTDAEMEGAQAYMVYGDDTSMSLAITLTNPQEFPIEVELTKPVPDSMSSVRIDANSGETTYDEEARVLTWKGTIDAADDVVITLEGKVHVDMEDTFAFEGGTLEITADDLFSHMKVVRSEGTSSVRFAIDKRQDAKEPEKWYITVFLKNLSEFDCRVNQVDLFRSGMDTGLLERYMPSEVLKPSGMWEDEFEMRSEGIPTISHRTSITMLPNIVKRQKSMLYFEGTESKIARVAISKTFDKSILKLGEKEMVAVTIFVENTGNAPVSSVVVEDEVPEGFELRNIMVEFEDQTIRKDLTGAARITTSEGRVTITVKDIEAAFGEVMAKGDYFEITYDLVSDGAIEGTYETEVRGYANTDPPGARISMEASEEMPLMKVTNGLQGIFMSKDLVSTQNEDEIKFIIYMKNKGRVPLDDLVVRDLFPNGFDLVKSSHEYKIVQTNDKGVVAEWSVDTLDVNEEYELVYVLRGSGDYSIADAVVMVGG